MNNEIRTLYMTAEFSEFYNALPAAVKEKYDYVMQIIKRQRIVNARFVKNLENTPFYEMRVSISSNEYRSVIFAVDNENFMLATRIVLLNSLLKKSTKQYRKEIEKASAILERFK